VEERGYCHRRLYSHSFEKWRVSSKLGQDEIVDGFLLELVWNN